MNKILLLIVFLVVFVGCTSKNSELKKIRFENDKLQAENQKLEKDVLVLQTYKMYNIATCEIEELANALIAYETDYGTLPDIQSLTELSLSKEFVPFYIKKVPVKDPWGKPYGYLFKKDERRDVIFITIYSGGSDGIFDGLDQSRDQVWKPGIDIIYFYGDFEIGATKDIK